MISGNYTFSVKESDCSNYILGPNTIKVHQILNILSDLI